MQWRAGTAQAAPGPHWAAYELLLLMPFGVMHAVLPRRVHMRAASHPLTFLLHMIVCVHCATPVPCASAVSLSLGKECLSLIVLPSEKHW